MLDVPSSSLRPVEAFGIVLDMAIQGRLSDEQHRQLLIALDAMPRAGHDGCISPEHAEHLRDAATAQHDRAERAEEEVERAEQERDDWAAIAGKAERERDEARSLLNLAGMGREKAERERDRYLDALRPLLDAADSVLDAHSEADGEAVRQQIEYGLLPAFERARAALDGEAGHV